MAKATTKSKATAVQLIFTISCNKPHPPLGLPFLTYAFDEEVAKQICRDHMNRYPGHDCEINMFRHHRKVQSK